MLLSSLLGKAWLTTSLSHYIASAYQKTSSFIFSDSAHQQRVPNLDGGDGHSEHIIFGTNLDLTKSSEGEGGGEGGVNQTRGFAEENNHVHTA